MGTLKIDFGNETEELLRFVFEQFDDKEIDIIHIEREQVECDGLASEPTTTMALIGLTSVLAIGVCRLIERYLEERRQLRNMELILQAYELSEEAGRTLAKVAESHSNVVVSFGELPQIAGDDE